MEKDKIVIDIDNELNIKAETFKMEGDSCINELTKLFKEVADLNDQDKKEEFFKQKLKPDSLITNKNKK